MYQHDNGIVFIDFVARSKSVESHDSDWPILYFVVYISWYFLGLISHS